MMPEYEAVIGMEVHAELLTESKMFCGCRNAFGGEPNTRCCPVCLGMPGALPVINKLAVEHVVKTALALNCSINLESKFDRKNYFYPDLPKGYQISQYDQPLGVNGYLDIEVAGAATRVSIRRVHLEEDTGKLFHTLDDESEVDYNRSGVPLMEIVTEFPPDMHSPEEARAYLTKLRSILTYIGVSDGKMEQGSLRCEPNLSIRLLGSDTFGTKTEIKNLNSFKAVFKGIEFEVKRQSEVLNSGGTVVQETRGWNDASNKTFSQRSKEDEQEYRYFPDPDLVPLKFTQEWVDAIRANLPELPDATAIRFVSQFGIPQYDAEVLTQSRAMATFFEQAARTGDPKLVSNWMMGEFTRLLNGAELEADQSRITPEGLATLTNLIADGIISGTMAKNVFERMSETGEDPIGIVDSVGRQISDDSSLIGIIDAVVIREQNAWTQLVAGDEKKFGYFVGQVMKLSQGKANPPSVNRLIAERLENERRSLD